MDSKDCYVGTPVGGLIGTEGQKSHSIFSTHGWLVRPITKKAQGRGDFVPKLHTISLCAISAGLRILLS